MPTGILGPQRTRKVTSNGSKNEEQSRKSKKSREKKERSLELIIFVVAKAQSLDAFLHFKWQQK
jgi:hypothetical protein